MEVIRMNKLREYLKKNYGWLIVCGLLLTNFLIEYGPSISDAIKDIDLDDDGYVDVGFGGTDVPGLDQITADTTGTIYMFDVGGNCEIGDTCAANSIRATYGGMAFITGDYDVKLPAAVTGMSICIYNEAANTIAIDPNDSDYIILDGVTAAVGEHIENSTAAIGDFMCLVAKDTTYWTSMGYAGSWEEDTPP